MDGEGSGSQIGGQIDRCGEAVLAAVDEDPARR
jgi:hypothetical protein